MWVQEYYAIMLINSFLCDKIIFLWILRLNSVGKNVNPIHEHHLVSVGILGKSVLISN